MTKKMKVIGVTTAAVLAISSISVFAADAEYNYLPGRAKGSRYASTDERTEVENYGFRNGGNLETRLAAGEITQEEYDDIKAEKGSRGAKPDEMLAAGEITQEEYDDIKAEIEARLEEKNISNGKKGRSGFGKGKVKSESNIGTDTEA